METKIEVLRYDPHKMAFIKINDKVIFTGNYHDFHADCHGSKIGGYDLTGLWDRGIDSLATALKLKIGESCEIDHKKISREEYELLLYGKVLKK